MKRVLKTVLVLAAIILPLTLMSCTDSSSEVYAKHTNARVSVNFTNKDPKVKSLETGDTSINIYGVDNCYWTYTAKMDGNDSAVGTQTEQKAVKAEAGLGQIDNFEPGTWTFKLYAYKESGHSTLLYESKEITKKLEADKVNKVETINFPVSKVQDSRWQGSIEVVTSGTNAITFKNILSGETFVLEDVPVTDKATGTVVTTLTDLNGYKANLPAGTYELDIKFVYEGASYTAYPIVEVYSNFTTTIKGSVDARQMGTYTIEYKDKDDKTFTGRFEVTSPTTHTYGTATPLVDAVKDYYTFDGWSTDSNWSTKITVLDKGVWENTILYAKWTPIEYNISYNFNEGGDTTLDKKNATSHTSYNVETETFTVDNPTRTGFTFGGWTSGTDTTTMSSLSIAKGSHGDLSFKANWKEHTYTIVFSTTTDDVSGSMSSLTKKYSDKYDLPDVGFTRDGFTFVGWSYTAGGSKALGNKEKDVEKLTSTDLATVTLYTVWAENSDTPYKVEHYFENLDGIYVTDTTLKATENKTTVTNVTVTADTTAPDGFTYNTTSSTNSGVVKGDGSLVLKCYYDRNSYTLAWDFNGGTSTTDAYSKNGSYKYEAVITAPTLERSGYTFSGWTPAIPSGNKMPTTNLNFKAAWTAEGDTPYKVEHYFETLEGSYVTDTTLKATETKQGATDTTATASPVSVTGYTYNATMSSATDSGIIKGDGSLILKLYYTRNVHTLTWDFDGGNAGNGFTTNGDYKFGSPITSPTSMEKTGYTFAGWNNTIPDAMPDSNVSVKANWTAKSYKVKFNKNDNSGSTSATNTMADQDRVYDETPKALGNNFVRTGYKFDCWATSSDGTGTTYTDTELCKNLTTGSDITLYAQWKANSYKLKFDGNKGDGSTAVKGTMAEQNRTFDDTKTALGNSFSRDGYKFSGWYLNADGTGDSYTTGTEYNNFTTGTDDVTLYAMWIANEYTITLDANGHGSDTSTTVTFDKDALTSFTPASADGVVLKGYYTTTGTDGVLVVTTDCNLAKGVTSYTDADGNWIMLENVTLYAQWNVNASMEVVNATDVTINYDGDGTLAASISTYGPVSVAKGDTSVSVGSATCIGNPTLDGFYTDMTYSTKVLNADGTVVTDTNVTGFTSDGTWACTQTEVTLYARWIPNGSFEVLASTDVTLSYDANGMFASGVSTYGPQSVAKDATQLDVVSVTCVGTPVLSGFYTDTTFAKKVLNADGSVVSGYVTGYVENGKWACSQAKVTLYAKWAE